MGLGALEDFLKIDLINLFDNIFFLEGNHTAVRTNRSLIKLPPQNGDFWFLKNIPICHLQYPFSAGTPFTIRSSLCFASTGPGSPQSTVLRATCNFCLKNWYIIFTYYNNYNKYNIIYRNNNYYFFDEKLLLFLILTALGTLRLFSWQNTMNFSFRSDATNSALDTSVSPKQS